MSTFENIKQICTECENTNFFKEDGYYYCSTCYTKVKDLHEQVVSEAYDPVVTKTTTKIRNKKSNDNLVSGLTSWELYNYALIGLVDELIALGADPAIKLTTLQLWATYLQKLEVAFISTTSRLVPKLSLKYNKKDAQIIYGFAPSKRKRRKVALHSSSASVISEGSSARSFNMQRKRFAASEYEKSSASEASTNYTTSATSDGGSSVSGTSNASSRTRTVPKFNKSVRKLNRDLKIRLRQLPRSLRSIYKKHYLENFRHNIRHYGMTVNKMFCLIYLALKIHDQNINMDDLLRFSREGHLSYYKIFTLIPENELTIDDNDRTKRTTDLSYSAIKLEVYKMAKLLGVFYFVKPDLLDLIEKYCTQLQLPRGIMLYAKRLCIISKPKMKRLTDMGYEARAMAFVIVAMKLLFSFDGATEYEISKLAEEINRKTREKGIVGPTLFSFREWQWYIECRKHWLSMIHLPTRIKYNLDDEEMAHLHYNFLRTLKPVQFEETKSKTQNLKRAFDMWYNNLDRDELTKGSENFDPSFEFLHAYLQQILQNPNYDLPDILKVNFVDTKVGYLTRPKKLIDLAAQCDIELEVLDTDLNYITKKIPYGTVKRDKPGDPQEKVNVRVGKKLVKKAENIMEYVDLDEVATVTINEKKLDLFKRLPKRHMEAQVVDEDDFCFTESKDSGKLLIKNDSEDESDDEMDPERTPDICLTEREKKALTEKHMKYYVRNPVLREVYYVKNERNATRLIAPSKIKEVEAAIKEKNSGEKVMVKRFEYPSSEDDSNQILDDFRPKLFRLKNDDKNINSDKSKKFRLLLRPHKYYWTLIPESTYIGKYMSRSDKSGFFHRKVGISWPASFYWLVNECAATTETKPWNICKEVCFVENYFNCYVKKNVKSYRRLFSMNFTIIENSW